MISHLTQDISQMYINEGRNFAFKNQQVANSPYYLVKGYPDQSIIRQSEYENTNKLLEGARNTVKFQYQLERGDFVKNQVPLIPSDKRFANDDKFDKSVKLTNVKRIQIRNFSTYVGRDTDTLILQGGDVKNTHVVENIRNY